ncbi:hypothetical protein [Azospirillum sp. B510]|uniref:hypothetical protein n=1 Tax=Azospirillum sp. (strain B510) TaxID=137722 RepID=UPI0011D0BD01|nr:hypothetical protein [Azospirillum sp. B510]
MSIISAAGLPVGNLASARSTPGTTADMFVKKPAPGADGGGFSPSTKVDLSDRAKAMLASAEKGRAAANQLAAQLLGGGRSPNPEMPGAVKQGAEDALLSLKAGGSSGQAADAVAAVREWAKSDVFRNAAKGVADDQVRALVRDGKLPELPKLTDKQYAQLSEEERNIYGTVSTLQGLYSAMPKTLDQALADRKKVVLESYPDDISRMRSGLASGALKKEDGWEDVIAGREAELTAAMQGKMKIHAVNDPALVQSKGEFTVSRNAYGWSGSGMTVNGNGSALEKTFGTKNFDVGSSPYTGDYVITW